MLDDAQVVSALAARDIVPDATQRDAIAALVTLLGANGPMGRRAKSGSSPAHQGVYCHGLPGRGKSLVVDTVFELASCRKRRLHFHEFLREMNRRLVNEPRGDDRLGSVSRQWLDGVELLCFDEFHVHDIADAFLMGRFLDTIKRCFTAIHFDGARDYRFGGEEAALSHFFAPLDAATGDALLQIFVRYEGNETLEPATVSAAGRPLAARSAGAALLWADFENLCVASRSHLDYLDLAEHWHGLILDQVHTEWLARAHTLQRLIWLVDIFYDRKCALFIASNQPIEAALSGLEGAHDLSRTLSRLAEMQSRGYRSTLDNTAGRTGIAETQTVAQP